MKVFLIVAWLFVGLAGVIYHVGPGQKNLEVDRTAAVLRAARYNVNSENWAEAVDRFETVLGDLPETATAAERHGIELEKAKAQMMAAKLPEARESLKTLLQEVRDDKESDPKLIAEVESALANAQYYTTWLMRLEGLPEAEWKPEIEAARQHYAQLTSDAKKRGDEKMVKRSSEDLESAIRLARLDISELQGLPLPSQ